MKTIIKNILFLAAIGCAAAALASRWAEVSAVWGGTRWEILAVAAAGLLAYQFVNAGVWSLVLGALGTRAGFWRAARVWVESEALRWLPGGIWGYGSRVVSAKSLGAGKGTAAASLVVEVILTNMAWAAAACLLVASPLGGEIAALASGMAGKAPAPAVLAVMVLLAGGFAVVPAGRRMVAGGVQAVLQRVPWRELEAGPGVKALASYIMLCVFNGCLLWLVTRAVPGLDLGLLDAIGAAGAAWLVGFWALGVPGGIGVREAALCGLLAHFGSLEAGMAVAVLWRALQVGVELTALGVAALTRGIERRHAPRRFAALRLFNA